MKVYAKSKYRRINAITLNNNHDYSTSSRLFAICVQRCSHSQSIVNVDVELLTAVHVKWQVYMAVSTECSMFGVMRAGFFVKGKSHHATTKSAAAIFSAQFVSKASKRRSLRCSFIYTYVHCYI